VWSPIELRCSSLAYRSLVRRSEICSENVFAEHLSNDKYRYFLVALEKSFYHQMWPFPRLSASPEISYVFPSAFFWNFDH
jgi:hypothetical protein